MRFKKGGSHHGVLKSALSFYGWCWKHYAPWPWHERYGRVSGFGVTLFAVGHLLFILGLVLYVEARRELLWPAVMGTITVRDTTSSECPRFRPENVLFVWRIWREIWPEDGDRRCIEVTVSYNYPVSGSDYVRKFRQTHEERAGRAEGTARLPRYMEGDTVEVRYNPRDHAHSTLTVDVEHLRSSGASLLKWGLVCVLFGMLGAGLSRLGENE